MVSTDDVGEAVAGELTGTNSLPTSVVEVEGPAAVSAEDAASAFARVLGRAVTAVAVPESDWPARLAGSQFSLRTIEAWMELFRGFNSGLIGFEHPAETRRGRTSLDAAVAGIAGSR